eukprot:TRINITY_DN2783_c0_g1_i1.p1 TRINITY_DN2783_c0_g1~~TRINITY_DN2783_c0_g1_i1.p1  ORF type:complete len:381 (-),score=60.30 TRINITY_DN2783_c0_g1_i1:193-1335(-)
MADDDIQELDLSNSDVVSKYKTAAEICNKSIAEVISKCKAGANVYEICVLGDNHILEQTGAIYKGKKIEKGVAFPTCLSINSVVGHFTPNQGDATELKDGDVVKIDMGCHIDGFVATQATTVVVQEEFGSAITGKVADLISAANTTFELAMRLIRPGKRVSDVAGLLSSCVEAYGVQLVEGVMTHNMKQFVIDGNKVVLNKPSPDARVDDSEFLENEVYAIDIVVSTGEGKTRMLDEKETNIYKRALDVEYSLKLKTSRAVFSEITKKYPTMPFSIRNLENKQVRMGLSECLSHGLLHPYPVLHEKPGIIVAQIKGTVLLMPNGSDRITTAELQPLETDKKCEDQEILDLLAVPLKKKKKKSKKAKETEEGGESSSKQEE